MKIKTTLYRQLISIIIIILGIIFISLGLLLPNLLLPIYEKNIYEYLKQPLNLIKSDLKNTNFNDIGYLYIVNNEIIVSDNLTSIIELNPIQVIEYIQSECGKFTYLGRTYYYYMLNNNHVKKIALTNNDYILNIRSDIMEILLPTLIMTLIISVGMIVIWVRRLVYKIELLEKKVENIDNDEYVNKFDSKIDDELTTLSNAIDQMRVNLKTQEEYKNQMYQNISHDFKTPLMVIKSHMEAIDDGVLDPTICKKVINEQVDKLEAKVHSLLYLNKLAYIKEIEYFNNEKMDIKPIIDEAVNKFRFQRKDVEIKVDFIGKSIFNGTYDMWEAIIDNLLNNFLRYADKQIQIKVKNSKITFYNDGPNIDENIFDDLFTPYKKGINGQFGLGLSIVKKTLNLLGYEISVINEKKGVIFTIKQV